MTEGVLLAPMLGLSDIRPSGGTKFGPRRQKITSTLIWSTFGCIWLLLAQATQSADAGVFGHSRLSVLSLVNAAVFGQAKAPGLSPAATSDYQAAAGLQERGSYDLAAEAWQRFIREYPQDPRVADAYFFWAVCEYNRQAFPEAAAAFQEAAKRLQDPKRREEALFFCAVSLLKTAQGGSADRAAEAIQAFNRFFESYPNSPRRGEALYCQGEAFYLIGQKAEAARCYQQALEQQLPPAIKAAAQYGLGVCFEELQRPQEALAQFEAFLREFRDDPLAADVAVRLGDQYFAAKRYDLARQRFEEVLGSPDAALAAYALLRLADASAAMGQLPEAVRLYQKLRQQHANTEYAERAALAAGKALRRLQQWEDALREFQAVIDSGSSSAEEAAVLAAETLLDAGKAEEALAQAEELLRRVKTPTFVDQLELVRAEALDRIPQKKEEALKALAALAEKQAVNPAVISAAFRAGWLAVELGQPERAIGFLGRFLELAPADPRAPRARLIMAEAYLLSNKLDEAEKTYNSLISQFGKDRALVEMARVGVLWINFLKRRYSDVVAQGSEVVRAITNPELAAEAHYLVGASFYEQKQFGESIKALEQALKTAPHFRVAEEAQLYLARAYLRQKQFPKAKELLEALTNSAVSNTIAHEAHFWLAEVEYQLGQREQTVHRYRVLLQQNLQEDLAARVRYALATTLNELAAHTEALSVVDELLQRHGSHSLAGEASLLKSRLLLQLNRPAEAGKVLEESLKMLGDGPLASQARFLLALCYLELEQPRPALNILEQLRANPSPGVDESEVLYQLGWAYKLNNQPEKASEIFKDLVKKAEKEDVNPEVVYQAAEYFFAEKNYREAATAYHRASNLSSTTGRVDLYEICVHRYAWCFFRLKQFAEASKVFDFQLKHLPKGKLASDARLMLAECYVRLAREQKRGPAPSDGLAVEEVLLESASQLYKQAWDQYQILVKELDKLTQEEFRPLALLRAGETAAQLGLWEESERYLERCIRDYPQSPYLVDALCQRGWTLWKLGQAQEAVNTLKKAGLSGDSESAARARFLLGEIHFHEKRYREAILEFMAVADGYGYPALQLLSLYEAARCYEQLKRPEEARKLYQEIVDKFAASGDPKVDTARKKLGILSNPEKRSP